MKPDEYFKFDENEIELAVSKQAILFHSTGIETNGYREAFIASLHDFMPDSNGEMVVGAGKLLLKEDVEAILRQMLALDRKSVSLLPSNVVSVSSTHIAWTVPAQVRPMLFNITGMPFKSLSVPWPRLLIVANNQGKLAVAALKGRGRLSAKTKIFNAPLLNIGRNGDVCTGSAQLPADVKADDIKQWESVLFDTAFSHVNNLATLKLDKKDGVDTKTHYKFWASLARRKEVAFPSTHLVPMAISLEEFIRCAA